MTLSGGPLSPGTATGVGRLSGGGNVTGASVGLGAGAGTAPLTGAVVTPKTREATARPSRIAYLLSRINIFAVSAGTTPSTGMANVIHVTERPCSLHSGPGCR